MTAMVQLPHCKAVSQQAVDGQVVEGHMSASQNQVKPVSCSVLRSGEEDPGSAAGGEEDGSVS